MSVQALALYIYKAGEGTERVRSHKRNGAMTYSQGLQSNICKAPVALHIQMALTGLSELQKMERWR